MTKQNRTPSPKFAQIGTSNEQEEFKKKSLKSNLTFGDPSKLSQGSSSPHFQSDQYNLADIRGKDLVHQTSEQQKLANSEAVEPSSRRVTFQHPIHQESRPQPAIDSYRPRTNEQHELPLYQLSGQTDHEEEIEEEKEEPRPARFAHFRGFNEPETSPPQTHQSTRRRMDDTFAITEDHDMYEDIRHQPEDQEPEPEKNSRTRKRAENRSIEGTANQPGTERRSTGVEKFDNRVQPDYHSQSDMKGDEDLMLNMLHQQAKIFENQITKQRSLDA